MPSSVPAGRPRAPLRYRVWLRDAAAHEIDVELRVPALGRTILDLVFPAWAPGSYMIRDFSRHVYDLTFRDARGRPLPAERMDKLRWRVRCDGEAVTIRYRVFAFEVGVRTAFFDDTRAFWNGTNLFFYVDGERARPCEVRVEAPRSWRVSTALPRARGGAYVAANVDELYDAPFEVGTHAVYGFRERGAAFAVTLQGRTNADVARLVEIVRRIVRATGALFGGFPFARYVFIVHALPSRGGGLEHASSCTLDVAGLGFEDEKGYLSFAALAAHEFFHAWNVKRIRDRALVDLDYTRENYTRLLWFHEGFTNFMEGIVLLRAGLVTPERYLKDLAEEWQRYAARPGRNVTPLAELSFEAWIKQYKPADNHHNRAVSYYDKGKWAGLMLELLLRRATGGRRGLADVFRRLMRDFGARGIGVTAEDVRAAAEAVGGRSLGSYFAAYIDGTDELPVPRLLRQAGLRVAFAPRHRGEDDPVRRRRGRAYAGWQVGHGERAIVRSVAPGSPAWRAGLTYGDEIVALGGARVSAGTLARRLADLAPGDRARIAFFRRDELRTATLIVAADPERALTLAVDPAARGLARAIRRGFLGV